MYVLTHDLNEAHKASDNVCECFACVYACMYACNECHYACMYACNACMPLLLLLSQTSHTLRAYMYIHAYTICVYMLRMHAMNAMNAILDVAFPDHTYTRAKHEHTLNAISAIILVAFADRIVCEAKRHLSPLVFVHPCVQFPKASLCFREGNGLALVHI